MSWVNDNPEGTSTPDQEMAWMLRFKDGDQHGFLKILHRYEKPVVNFSFRYLKDQQAAEDVAQEVFLEVFQCAQKYRPTGKLSTWIFTIAYRRCIDLLRRRKILTFFSLDSWFSSDEDEHRRDIEDTQQSTPLQDEEKNEIENAVTEALAALPETQRTAVLLAKYEDMSLDEIAYIMGISVGAVKQLLFRAKNALKEKLKPCISETDLK